MSFSEILRNKSQISWSSAYNRNVANILMYVRDTFLDNDVVMTYYNTHNKRFVLFDKKTFTKYSCSIETSHHVDIYGKTIYHNRIRWNLHKKKYFKPGFSYGNKVRIVNQNSKDFPEALMLIKKNDYFVIQLEAENNNLMVFHPLTGAINIHKKFLQLLDDYKFLKVQMI